MWRTLKHFGPPLRSLRQLLRKRVCWSYVGAAEGCEAMQTRHADTQFRATYIPLRINSDRFSAMEATEMQALFKGHYLRKYRVSQVGNFYVLTGVVAEREPVFQDWRVGRRVVEQFRSAHERGLVESMAWVIMPDHFHWLVELRAGTLSTLMCQVKSRSSRAIKLAYCRSGSLWQRGYYERMLRRDEDVLAAARYIVANPQRAGLVRRIGNYPLWDARWI